MDSFLQKVEIILNQKQNVVPSLVHGDLWSGNIGFLRTGEPVIFDPATYYGDREVDIAMTELFGRLPDDFYDAYNDEFPLQEGYEQRRTIYNLYHVLNHFVCLATFGLHSLTLSVESLWGNVWSPSEKHDTGDYGANVMTCVVQCFVVRL